MCEMSEELIYLCSIIFFSLTSEITNFGNHEDATRRGKTNCRFIEVSQIIKT
jgi:hypothetical protein